MPPDVISFSAACRRARRVHSGSVPYGQGGEMVNYAIAEYVENAGIHSGDATLLLPAQMLFVETHRRVKMISQKLCRALQTCNVNLMDLATRIIIGIPARKATIQPIDMDYISAKVK